MVRAEFKFLCSTYHACPETKEILAGLGFTDFKDLANSPSFDIRAKFELKNEEEREAITKKIFEKCKGKVQSIQINV